jgi:hypothetical protein
MNYRQADLLVVKLKIPAMIKNVLLSIFAFIFFGANAQTLLDTAVNFSVKDVYGNSIELFAYLDDDKIVVIDFFASS